MDLCSSDDEQQQQPGLAMSAGLTSGPTAAATKAEPEEGVTDAGKGAGVTAEGSRAAVTVAAAAAAVAAAEESGEQALGEPGAAMGAPISGRDPRLPRWRVITPAGSKRGREPCLQPVEDGEGQHRPQTKQRRKQAQPEHLPNLGPPLVADSQDGTKFGNTGGATAAEGSPHRRYQALRQAKAEQPGQPQEQLGAGTRAGEREQQEQEQLGQEQLSEPAKTGQKQQVGQPGLLASARLEQPEQRLRHQPSQSDPQGAM